jgi:hypothetical protein
MRGVGDVDTPAGDATRAPITGIASQTTAAAVKRATMYILELLGLVETLLADLTTWPPREADENGPARGHRSIHGTLQSSVISRWVCQSM